MPSKRLLRMAMNDVMKRSSSLYTFEAERQLLEHVRQVEEFINAKTVSIFINMPMEVPTRTVIEECFRLGKVVFVPKVVGPSPDDMIMVEIASFRDIEGFPRNKWNIPEPSQEYTDSNRLRLENGDLDLVFVPGSAFDRKCGRLGHGKGYYDCFLRKLQQSRELNHKAPSFTIGLGFNDQVVDEVPMEAHDKYLDVVITSNNIYRRNHLS